ncbi:MAG: hypothetical protein D6737_02440 [Chloroflexi bacterium]|nr:MAG: hypothetical protein D6737_02440 [Chloroflexota bacterium]
MTQIAMLYRLQEIDLKNIQVQKRLQEIDAALGDNAARKKAEEEFMLVQEELKPLQKQARNIEFEIEANAEKSRQTEERLYGGTVRNPKEMQDMQNEIAALKKRNAELDDRLLELMLAIEEVEERLAEKQAQLEQVSQASADEHRQLLEEREQLLLEIETLAAERTKVYENISAENRDIYDTMRKQKNNLPIALLNGSACSVCGVEQSSSILQEARRGQSFVKCNNCGRILYFK